MHSPSRAELLREGADLVAGEPREQVLALAEAPDPVTAVASFRVRPGHDIEHAELLDRLRECLVRAPGFLRTEVFDPVAGLQDDTVIVFSFDTREHLDDWLRSEERLAILDEILDHVEGERTVNVVGGFAGWFGGGGAPEVKRWKQASVVLLALYPTALVLTLVREWLLPDIHWTLGVLFGNAVGVVVLSWVLMPWLTRLLDGWLRR
jgi:antibiotic biosynthesis monooxygenase (ABM) superfamily enzyme